jgi:tripartite-type tricarboxylate transporter receptor subunit TctC
LPGYEVVGWMALYGPAKLPAAITDRVADATRRVLASADFQARLTALGYAPWVGNGGDLAAHATKERAMWGTVTKGIEID